ncbi:MAG: hypothetical protein JEY91_19690 [Spirochaetaceae bacterium]|nr:hypothetical protein [Spirochaetaceae bacterium]
MMMSGSYRFYILIFLLFINFLYFIYGQESRFTINSPRESALGGAHAALTDDFSTIFNNPAGFRGVNSDFTVSGMTFKVTGPVSTMMLAAQGGDLLQIIGDMGSTNIGLDIIGPFSMGRIKNNNAWGVYNVIDANVFIPSLTQDAVISGRFDLGGVFGYSFGIDFIDSNNQMNFGFLTKLFFRTEMNIEKSFIDIMSSLSDIEALFSPSTLPLDMGFGVGIDIGIKYIWNDVLSIALAVRDLYTPLFMFRFNSLTSLVDGEAPQFEYVNLPQDYSIGILYEPDISFFNGLLANIKIMFDYNDIFDFALNHENARHILLHFGLGGEFTLFDILSLRFGFYEGLPAFGAGLDLHMFKFNFAMFGRELSTQPGLMSVYNLMFGIDFSY